MKSTESKISGIAIDSENTLKLWISINKFSENNKVFYTQNAGLDWENISFNLPNIPVNCIILNSETGDLYIGTDIGVFRKESDAERWEKLKNLPIVVVGDLKINYETNDLYITTYGRGVWKMKF